MLTHTMWRKLVTLFCIVVSSLAAHAQWDIFFSTTMRNTAKLHAHGSVLFHYDNIVQRSTDGGATWTIVPEFTKSTTAMTSVQNTIVAIVYNGPSNPMRVVASSDDGITWSEIGQVFVANNGIIHEIVYDGNVLYGVSNRDGVFLSYDQGKTWGPPLVYATSAAGSAIDGTIGPAGMFVLSTSGLYQSQDGTTWIKHGAEQQVPSAPQQIELVNGDVFLLGLYGLHRWDADKLQWIDISNTLPSFATLTAQLRDVRGWGSTVYAVGSTFDGISFALISTNRGTTWRLFNDPLPASSGVTRRALAVTPQYVVVFHNGVGGAAIGNGYYRTVNGATSVQEATQLGQTASILPIPVLDQFTLLAPSDVVDAEVDVHALSGELVHRSTRVSSGTRVDVGSLPPGAYIVNIRADEKRWTVPLLKQ